MIALALLALGCSEYNLDKADPSVETPLETGAPTDLTRPDTDDTEVTDDSAVTDTVVVETGHTEETGETDPPPGTDATTRGTVFWIGFMENLDLAFNGPPKFAVVVTSEVDTAGVVEVPRTGLTVPFTVAAGVPEEVALPDATWYPESSEVAEDKGLRVVVDDDATVHFVHYRLYFTDASMALPEPELGSSYTVIAADDTDYPSSFVIVATADDTEVEITPSAVTNALRPADVPFTVTLQAGQVYQVQAANDLTGSLVRTLSGEPIGVVGGAQQADVVCTPDSHVMDALMPDARLGTEYVVVPFNGQGGDPVKIVASQDGTLVRLDCGAPIGLDRGEVAEINATAPLHITSNLPIGVAQFNKSQSCNASNVGDPSMLVLPPVALTAGHHRWEALVDSTFQGAQRHGVNAVTDGLSLVLDGVDVSAELAPIATMPGWSSFSKLIPGGDHELTGDGRIHATAYGFSEYDAYTFAVGYDCEGCVEPLGEPVTCK